MKPAVSPVDDLTAVRSLLGPANPEPDPTLPRDEVLAARAAVGMARVAARPATRLRGRFVAAGAVALLSVATLVAVVAVPGRQEGDTVNLATGPGAKAIGAASAATEAAGTARGLLTVAHEGRTVTASGIGDFASGDASAEIALGGAGPSAQRPNGASPGGAQGQGTVTVLRTGTGIYARMPEGLNPLASGKPWLSVDAATLARLTQLALGDLGAQITGAPLDALTYLKAVSGDVQPVGPDTVRGEATTRYRGTIDVANVAAQLPEALRPPPFKTLSASAQQLPAELWIDRQGRLRKLVVTALPPIGSASPGSPDTPSATLATVTLELFEFGVPVKVEAPPADQVADVGGLLGTFLQNAGRP